MERSKSGGRLRKVMGTNSYVTVASGVPENPKVVGYSLVK